MMVADYANLVRIATETGNRCSCNIHVDELFVVVLGADHCATSIQFRLLMENEITFMCRVQCSTCFRR